MSSPSTRPTETSVPLGHLVVPEGGGPGVVILHDVWGLYEHYRDLARRLAGEGFVTLAVDGYRDVVERPTQEAPGAFMRELSDATVLAAVQDAVDFLAAHPAVGGRPVGLIGFCMGGSYTILAAAKVRGLGAAVPFYGVLSYEHGLYAGPPVDPHRKPVSPLDAAAEARCPVLAFFGREDALIPLSDVEELEARVRSARHPFSIRVFDGAGHAFVNDTRPQLYRPAQAKEAWASMLAFLRERLGSPA